MDRDERDLLCAFLIFTVVISVVGGFILYEAMNDPACRVEEN